MPEQGALPTVPTPRAPSGARAERATVRDAEAIHRMVNFWAGRGDMLPRTMGEVYENLRDFFVVREDGEAVACGALHITWADLAEVKSLAVREDRQSSGYGSLIVRACIEEGRNLGLERLFALTYRPGFFERLGFQQVDVMTLPRKVWNECYRCPKFPGCNEIAMVLDLAPPGGGLAVADGAPPAELLRSETLAESAYLRMTRDAVRFPDGTEASRTVVWHPGAVALVVQDDQGCWLMVEQYRHPAGRTLLEIPAGTREADEAPEVTAAREVREETGYAAERLDRIGGAWMAPGFTSEYIDFYLATGLRPDPLPQDHDEFIAPPRRLTVDQVRAAVRSGEVQDAKTMVALALYDIRLQAGLPGLAR